MAPEILIQLQPPCGKEDEVELVGDLDEFVESSKCSCNAGDDNPY